MIIRDYHFLIKTVAANSVRHNIKLRNIYKKTSNYIASLKSIKEIIFPKNNFHLNCQLSIFHSPLSKGCNTVLFSQDNFESLLVVY